MHSPDVTPLLSAVLQAGGDETATKISAPAGPNADSTTEEDASGQDQPTEGLLDAEIADATSKPFTGQYFASWD